MRVAAVVVTYRSRACVDGCLDALAAGLEAGLVDEVVVVDNASGDGTAEAVVGAHPWVRLVEAPANLGFGRAVNLGAGAAAPGWDALLLVNPDARPGLDVLRALPERLADDRGLAVVGPAMALPDGSRGVAGGPRPSLAKEALAASGLDELVPRGVRRRLAVALARTGAGRRGLGAHLASEAVAPGLLEVDWVSGFCALVRADAWHALDGFDPGYFLYFEDVDLCVRAGALGWRCAVDRDVACAHLESTSTRAAGKRRLVADGLVRYADRHRGPAARATARALAWSAR